MNLKSLSVLCALTLSTVASADTVTASYQDWWWDPAQSGMGVNIGQNDDTLVVAWYHFGEDGRGTYLMFSGELNGNTLSGDLYRTSGPQPGVGYDPSKVLRSRVGTATLQFPLSGQATMTYSFDGKAGKMTLQRFVFKQPDIPVDTVFGALYVLDKECTDTGMVIGTGASSQYTYRVDVDPENVKLVQFSPQESVSMSVLADGGYELKPVKFIFDTSHQYLLDGKLASGPQDSTRFECNYTFAFSDSAQGLKGAVGAAQCGLSMSGVQLQRVQGTYTGDLTVTHVTWNNSALIAEYSSQTRYQTAVCNEKGKIIFDNVILRLATN